MVTMVLVDAIFLLVHTCPHTAMTLSSILIKSMVSRTSEEHKTNRQKWTSSLVLRRILLVFRLNLVVEFMDKKHFFLGWIFSRKSSLRRNLIIADCGEAWVRLFMKREAIPIFAWHWVQWKIKERNNIAFTTCLVFVIIQSLEQGFLNVLLFKAVYSKQNIWEAS